MLGMQMKTLDGIDLLKNLSKEDKQTLCTSMREKVYKAGRMIICEGDESNTFYIIACVTPRSDTPMPPSTHTHAPSTRAHTHPPPSRHPASRPPLPPPRPAVATLAQVPMP